MLRAKISKELIVTATDEIGVLDSIARLLADKGINVRALAGWHELDRGVIRIVCDDHQRAHDALAAGGFEVSDTAAITVGLPHRPGMLRRITEPLARERINIDHLYASADGGDTCLVVLHTDSDDRAMVLLND